MTITWRRFFALIVLLFFVTNALFAFAYFLCGPDAIVGGTGKTASGRFLDSFFFSVQTLSTIGYGILSPKGLAANILVTLQSLTGLLFFALSTGLVFARFSRPMARIVFSDRAIIAPYHEITAFEFRIMNALQSQLSDVKIRVVFTRMMEQEGACRRIFEELPLERPNVTFFPLHLTVVHPIDENSPLFGMTEDELEKQDVEFIALLTAFDETFSTYVNTRCSYKYHETVVGARFVDMFVPSEDGRISVDMGKIHEIDRVDFP